MRTLTGSTLAETLVMMIVAGVIFLSVMDGLTLFTRLQTQRAAALVENGRAAEGYYRLENLITDADSICDEAGGLVLFRSGQQGLLAIRDSILLYVAADYRDTLFRAAENLSRFKGESGQPDMVSVRVRMGKTELTIRVVTRPGREENYRMELNRIEEGYGYDE